MTRVAFLHIGLPKTGTTYLQHVLWDNKQALAADGLLLPGRAHRAHLLASVEVRESPRLEKRAGLGATPWADLVEEAQAWDGDVLFTHEFFCAAAPHQVERIVRDLEGFEVRVVITARSMSRLGPSRWQEWVKNGGRRGVDAYPVREEYQPADDWGWGSFDLGDVLERWSSVIDPGRIHVLVLESGSRDPVDLWRRFATTLGVDPERYSAVEEPRNESLGVVEIELLRRVNAKLQGFRSAADRGTWIRGFLAEGEILPRRGERFRAGADKFKQFADKDQRAVDLLHGGGYVVDGDPADLLQEPDGAVRHPDEVTEAELLDSATTAIANLMDEVRRLSHQQARAGEPAAAATTAASLRKVRRVTDKLWRRR